MSSLPPPTTGPAGWYPAPDGHAEWYYDGRGWSARRRAIPTLPVRIGLVALGLLAVALWLAQVIGGWATDAGLPSEAVFVMVALVGYAPPLIWIGWTRRASGCRWATYGWGFAWPDVGWGFVTWLCATAVQVGLGLIVVIFGVPTFSNTEGLEDLSLRPSQWVVMVVVTVGVAPVVEELIFRGAVLRSLRSVMSDPLAVVAQGVIFGLAHFDPGQGASNLGLVLVLAGVGCAFGAAAVWIPRIGPCVVAHAIFNAVALAVVTSGFSPDGLGALGL